MRAMRTGDYIFSPLDQLSEIQFIRDNNGIGELLARLRLFPFFKVNGIPVRTDNVQR
jgi:hypothetical protein